MLTKSNPKGYQEKLKGIMQKTLSYGEKTLLTHIKLSKGSTIPIHNHIHEQTGFLISGQMEFTINGELFNAEPGDSWTILKNIPHGAFVVKDSIVIEVFSPVREDYLPRNEIFVKDDIGI